MVDGRRLVWIDPTQEKPRWEHKGQGEEIVGEPQLVGGVVVVADQSGHFVGLSPTTGQPLGPGYTLKANVAPAAQPVAFGPDQVFAPLTDGTVLLLSMRSLNDRVWAYPLFW